MNYVHIASVALVGLALAGCNILQSKEEQCLQSGRLDMKDPDSLKVVQNLGDRGQASLQGVDGFWLRYSATNSYGGRLSSNMACEKLKGKWVRSERMEQIALENSQSQNLLTELRATTAKLNKSTADYRSCKTSACRAGMADEAGIPDPTGERAIREAKKEADSSAKTAVYDGTGPL